MLESGSGRGIWLISEPVETLSLRDVSDGVSGKESVGRVGEGHAVTGF